MSGKKKDKKGVEDKKSQPPRWIALPSKTYPDRVFYYNTSTKCKTWENPYKPSRGTSKELSSSESLAAFTKNKKKNKRNKKKKKSKKEVQETAKINAEIEDYDEENDEFFKNSAINAHAKAVNSPSSPKPFLPSNNSVKINPTLKNDSKEIWLNFNATSEKFKTKKSATFGDMDKPSTSTKSSDEGFVAESRKRNRRSQSLSMSKKIEMEMENEKNINKKVRPHTGFESKRQSGIDKIISPTTFKKRDKTPAQTRLLKLREQSVKHIQEFIADSTKLSAQKPQELEFHLPEFSSKSIISLETPSTDAYMKSTAVQERAEEVNAMDFSEEMDWEPSIEDLKSQSSYESDQQTDRAPSSLSRDKFFELPSNVTSLPLQTNVLILVLDTNILVSCLPFIKDLRDTHIPGLGFPLLYIPWRVLQELDRLKDSKTNEVDRKIHVRMAISYINENFKTKHPRCIGQSFEDFAKMVDREGGAPDDEILQTCIQLQKLHCDKKLTLLTNDKNLESKALVSNVEAYSKDGFQKKFLSLNSSPVLNAATCHDVGSAASDAANQIDRILCGTKSILKNFISLIVETEMKIGFGDKWIKVVYKKPPWSLKDAMDCLLKHWRAVFFLVYSKDAQTEAESLYKKLFRKMPDSVEDAKEVVWTSQKFLTAIKNSLKEKRDYFSLIDVTMTKFYELLAETANKTRSQELCASNNKALPSRCFTSLSRTSLSMEANQSISQEPKSPYSGINPDVFKVGIFFKSIWDGFWNFCLSVGEAINSSAPQNEVPITELSFKTSQVLNEINMLITALDQVLGINLIDVQENHPLILELSNFLINLYPLMDEDMKSTLPHCLAAFLSDIPGRESMKMSLKDFKDFSLELSKAMDCFNSRLSAF